MASARDSVLYWTDIPVDYPKRVLLALGLVVTLCLGMLPQLKLDASSDALMLETDPDLKVFRDISLRYQAQDFLVIAYQANGDLLSVDVLKSIEALDKSLADLDGVQSVVSLVNVPFLYDAPENISLLSRHLRYLSDPETDTKKVRAELLDSDLYRELLVSPDLTTTALQVNLTPNKSLDALLAERDALNVDRLASSQSTDYRKKKLALERAISLERSKTTLAHEELISKVRQVMANHEAQGELVLGGVTMIASDMLRYIETDLWMFSVAILLLIIVVLMVIFRRIFWTVLLLTSCFVTALISLGLVSAMNWKLTVISSNFIALLLILSLSVSIHVAVRYRELCQTMPGIDHLERIRLTMRQMYRPCLYSVLTTLIAFTSLVVSGIRPVIDFGWMMAMGVIVCWLVVFLWLPSVLALVGWHVAGFAPTSGGSAVIRAEPTPGLTHRVASFCALISVRHSGKVLAVATVLLALSAWGIRSLEVENRFIDYFDSDTEIYRGMELIDKQLGGTIPLEVVIRLPSESSAESDLEAKADISPENELDVDDEFESGFGDDFESDFDSDFELTEFTDASQSATHVTPSGTWFSSSGIDALAALDDFLQSHEQVGKTQSILDLYSLLSRVNGAPLDDFQLSLILKNLPAPISSTLVRPYLSNDGLEVRINARVKETSHSLDREKLLSDIEDFLIQEMALEPVDFDINGMLVLYSNMLQSLYSSQIKTIGVVLLCIGVMFALLFRSLRILVIAIVPNALAAGIVLGGMGLAGLPLDLMTITIAAIVVGIGVDDTIHYLHRFKNELSVGGGYSQAIIRSHNTVGHAMIFTTLVIVIGFSSMLLSNFTPTLYFGVLTGLAMLSALTGALVLLPALLYRFKPFHESY